MKIMFGNGAAWRATYLMGNRGVIASVGLDPDWSKPNIWLTYRYRTVRIPLWKSRSSQWALWDGRNAETRWTVPVGALVAVSLLAYVASMVL